MLRLLAGLWRESRQDPLALPLEVLFKIISFLPPEKAIIVAMTSEEMRALIYHNQYWKEKYAKHFRESYAELLSTNPPDWRQAFGDRYAVQYKGLGKLARLFSLMKEQDVDGFLAEVKGYALSTENLLQKDATSTSLLDLALALNNQRIFNCFYEIAIKEYSYVQGSRECVNVHIRQGDRTLLYWAIACQQSFEVINFLLKEGGNVDEKSFPNELGLIHHAASLGNLDVVKGLIDAHPWLLNKKDGDGRTPLIWAMAKAHIEIVDYLLDKKADTEAVIAHGQDKGKRAIHCAIEFKNVRMLNCLLDAGANAFVVLGPTQFQPIHFALQNGNLEIVKTLIETQALSETVRMREAVDRYGQTPLLWAAVHGHLDIVDYLLTKRANVEVTTNSLDGEGEEHHGKTPLHWAAQNGHTQVVARLLDARAVAIVRAGPAQLQPIHLAVQQGHLAVVKILIENRPDLLNQTDAHGQTPLLLAVAAGKLEVVDFLLAKNADLEGAINDPMSEYHGQTPLYRAIESKNFPMVLRLLKAGANAAVAVGNMRLQPIHVAVNRNDMKLLATLLKKHPILLNQADAHGQTPLLLAAAAGKLEMVDFLLKKNADLEVATNDPTNEHHGKTPLYRAVEDKNFPMAMRLLEAGANAGVAAGNRQLQPIHIAVNTNDMRLLAAFLEKQPALLNQADAHGQTPLLLAVAAGRLKMVELLLRKGANLEVAMNDPTHEHHSKTPLYRAVENNDLPMVKLLLEAGADVAAGNRQPQPIHIAVNTNDMRFLAALLENRPDLLDQPDAHGQTPLLLAAAAGKLEMVDFLLSKGANLEVAMNDPAHENHGKTLLYLAVESKNLRMVKLLLAVGANAAVGVGDMQLQPIHIAVNTNDMKLLTLLLEERPDLLNQPDAHGQTPLLLAVQARNLNMVMIEFLLKKGANLEVTTNHPGSQGHGQTPTDYAIERRRSDLITLLLRHDAVPSEATKPLWKHLPMRVQAELRLVSYIAKRDSKPDYITYFTIFNRTINCGSPKAKKLIAARNLKAVKMHGADPALLDTHDPALRKGKLGKIYKRFRRLNS